MLLLVDGAHPVAQVQAAAMGLDVPHQRAMEPAVGGALQQVQSGCLCPGCKHHEDGQHAAGGDGPAIQKAQGIGDGIPQALQTGPAAPVAKKPLRKAEAIQGPNHRHGALDVHQAPHNGGSAQGQGITQLVHPAQLGRGEKRLEPVERRPQGKTKVKLPHVATGIDKQMGMLLGQQVVQGAHLGHEGKQVGVVVEEDVETHLDVVALAVHPTARLAPHKGAPFIKVHLVPGIRQLHRRRQPRQPRANNCNPHPVPSRTGVTLGAGGRGR